MYRDQAAVELNMEFISVYKAERKNVDYRTIGALKKLKSGPYWGIFKNAAKYRTLKSWTPHNWIYAQFLVNKDVSPKDIIGYKAEQNFNDYLALLSKSKMYEADGVIYTDNKLQMIREVLTSYKIVKEWCRKNDKNYLGYFRNKLNIIKIKRKSLSPYFLSICRSYMLNLPEFEDSESLSLKRVVVYKNKKLMAKLKSVMGDEFY